MSFEYSRKTQRRIAAHLARGWHLCSPACSRADGSAAHNRAVMELQDWQGHSDFNARLAGFETVTHDENGKAITHLPKILEGD